MNKEQSNNETPQSNFRLPLVVGVAASLCFLIMVTAVCIHTNTKLLPLLFFIFVVYLFIGLGAWCRYDLVNRDRKEMRREHRRQLARVKEATNLQAQLQKPDFESRLNSFVAADSEPEPDFESQMEFWEREDSYSRTSYRPIELIRSLLQRISKLVGQR